MTDYQPLIARAIAGLDENTGENRRALYERARGALVNQLRGVDPPLDEGEITRERLALEEAIRKVEAEAAALERAEPAPEPSAPTLPRAHGLQDFHELVAAAQHLGEPRVETHREEHEPYRAVGAMPGEAWQPPGGSRHDDEVRYFEPAAPEPMDRHAHQAPDRPFEAEHRAPSTAKEATPKPMPPPVEMPAPPEGIRMRRSLHSYGRLIAIAVIALVVLGLGAAAYWQRHSISSMVASLTTSKPTPAPVKPVAKPPVQPKIADRIGPASNGNPTTAPKQPANAPAASVAQKVVLYEEEPNNPQGKRYVGSAIWRTETVSPGPGLAPELAVRADVEIPERHIRMTWSLRRNTDKALPASHTIEITFTLPADFTEGGIGNVPGVLMKDSEQARGIPLAGLSVKVTNGYFLIGLSAVDIDKQRNIDLLKQRQWFDIPIVFTNGKRAILAMEKGPPGDRAFAEAFRAWGE